jgi:serine/threonine protein kinase
MKNERTIFVEALEKDAPAERSAFLDEACAGDAALRRRVEALLRSHAQAGAFLGKPVPERLAAELPTLEVGDAPTDPVAEDSAESLDFLEPSDQPGVLGRLAHYSILEVVGRGGMGIVLKAFDEQLRRVVAIKVMAPHVAASAVARQRFIREAQAAAAVRHEHVIDIHAVAEAHGLPYLEMEYIGGVSLQERLERTGPLQVKEILRIGLQAARGLSAAHAQGLVHRDIKPANILLENHVERVKLTDFGLARAVDDVKLTQTGVVAGSPQYMSPEQAEGRPVDQRCDLFSLGSVLYTLCTGRPPFRAPTTLAVLKRVCEETPRPIRENNPEVPEWLVEIIAKLHAKDPAQRFQTAAEVAQLLGTRLAELQHPAAAQVSPGGAIKSRRRWPRVAAALLVLPVAFGLLEALDVIRFVPALHRAPSDQAARGEPDQPVANTVIPPEADTQQVPAAVAPQAEAHPFVILARSSRLEQELNTLAEAVRLAWDGDTIEVRGNGPFQLSPICIKDQAVRIRAGDGFRPIFDVGLEQTRLLQGQLGGMGVIVSNSVLVLEGLEFRPTGPDPKLPKTRPSILSCLGPLYVANCRITGGSSNLLMVSGSRHCELCNCQIVGGMASLAYAWDKAAFRTVLRNNLIASGRMSNALDVRVSAVASADLQLTRNTLVGNRLVNLILFPPFPSKSGEPLAEIAGAPKSLRIQASGNTFDGTTYGGRADMLLMLSENRVEKPDELLQRRTSWTGDHNRYPPNACLSIQNGKDPTAVIRTGLAGWKQFWDDQEAGCVEGGRIRYIGGDVRDKASNTPEQLTPEDFRLHPESVGHAAGPNNEDLGADVDMVGPGPAYDRWKKTPEYQEWRKRTGQAK